MYATVNYVGNGSTVQYAVPFPYINRSHVHAYVNGAAITFTWVNAALVQLSATPANGATVRIRRETPVTPLTTFVAGSTLSEPDLNRTLLQSLYIVQEQNDAQQELLSVSSANTYDAGGRRIVNLGEPVDGTDAMTYASALSAVTTAQTAATNASSAATTATTAAATAAADTAASLTATVNGALASAQAAQAAAEAAAAAAEAAKISNRFGLRNLLYNARFLVNQRVFQNSSTGLPNHYYVKDRWKTNGDVGMSTNYSFSGSVLSITGNHSTSRIEQVIPADSFPVSGDYVLNWAGTAPATVDGNPVSKGVPFELAAGMNHTVSFYQGTVSYPQLERGTASTPFEERDPELELLLCLPFYQKSLNRETSPSSAGTTYEGMVYTSAATVYTLSCGVVQFRTPMRAAPTVTLYAADSGTSGNVRNMTTGTNVSLGVTAGTGSFYAVRGAGDLTPGHLFGFHWVATAEL